MPALGAGAALGAGLANLGDRPSATLPGLGDQRPGASQLPANPSVGERRDALSERLGGEQGRQDRQQTRDDRQENRGQTRDDRRKTGDERQQNRDQNRDDRQQTRDDRQQNRGQNLDDRQQNREQVRDDWQQQRDQIREDWQEHRDEARNDWQGFFDDHYGRYGGWYSGYAPGYWGRWDSLWDRYPVAAALGLTSWGANSVGYLFGYADYVNPYYVESMPAYYTEPIITVPIEPVTVQGTAQAAPQPPGVSAEAVTKFDQARAAFLEGRYEEALKLTDSAVAQMPRDAVLHEFRALVLFALQRYAEAAATIHPVLEVGPSWDWKTLSGLYPNNDVYTSQLRALETARDKNPKAAELRFLLGYHYLTCGYTDQALNEFRRTAELQPKDPVASALLTMLSPGEIPPTEAPAGAAPKSIPSDRIVASWTAAGKGTGKYSMTLRKDGTFTWAFTRGARKEEVKGVYAMEGNVLAMEPDSGGVLLAELTAKDPDTLHFKMVSGAADDAGLEFRRGAG